MPRLGYLSVGIIFEKLSTREQLCQPAQSSQIGTLCTLCSEQQASQRPSTCKLLTTCNMPTAGCHGEQSTRSSTAAPHTSDAHRARHTMLTAQRASQRAVIHIAASAIQSMGRGRVRALGCCTTGAQQMPQCEPGRQQNSSAGAHRRLVKFLRTSRAVVAEPSPCQPRRRT